MRQAIIFTSFGVADHTARSRTLDKTAIEIRSAFPQATVFQAYTSNFIRRRLLAEGFQAYSLPELLDSISDGRFDCVLVQPAHLTPGEEYERKIEPAVEATQGRFPQLILGEPIFMHDGTDGEPSDYAAVLEAVLPELKAGANETIVFVGHGSPHQPNPVYNKLQQYIDAKNIAAVVGVLEDADTPNFDMVLARLKQGGARDVLLAPLLLTGGSHVMDDMLGDAPDSWQNRLKDVGFNVRAEKRALGEFAAFRKLYLAKIRKYLPSE